MAEIRALAARPGTHPRHALHATDRAWPETNCYLDLWIGLLSAIGQDPRAVLGVAACLDWEEDHATFLKPNAADLFALTGCVLQELALWDRLEAQVEAQLGAGRVPLVEVDAFFLPDTAGAAWRERHTKTTIAIVAIDREARRLEYVHNAGLFALEADDYAGVLGLAPHQVALFPYAELVRLPAAAPPEPARRAAAREILARLSAMRAPGNPITRFAGALPGLIARTGGDPALVHALCFNTLRQIGSGFGLLADHLAWLGEDGAAAARLADGAKTLQFQLSRAARRGREDPAMAPLLAAMAAEWQALAERLERACICPNRATIAA